MGCSLQTCIGFRSKFAPVRSPYASSPTNWFCLSGCADGGVRASTSIVSSSSAVHDDKYFDSMKSVWCGGNVTRVRRLASEAAIQALTSSSIHGDVDEFCREAFP